MLQRVYDFIVNKEWAVTVSVIAVVATNLGLWLGEEADVFAEADPSAWSLMLLIPGVLTRARVWAKRTAEDMANEGFDWALALYDEQRAEAEGNELG